jgi:phosphoglycerate kinase
MGMAEWAPVWSSGTIRLAKFVAEKTESGEITSIIGGGDTVAILEEFNLKNYITYVSTGGGAFLEFIEGMSLPGIAALEK